MNYFECNVSRTVPKYYHPNIYRKLEETIELIHNRTDKLNQALEKCTLKGCATRGATFSRIAKTIFDFSDAKFDSMNPSELAGIISASPYWNRRLRQFCAHGIEPIPDRRRAVVRKVGLS